MLPAGRLSGARLAPGMEPLCRLAGRRGGAKRRLTEPGIDSTIESVLVRPSGMASGRGTGGGRVWRTASGLAAGARNLARQRLCSQGENRALRMKMGYKPP